MALTLDKTVILLDAGFLLCKLKELHQMTSKMSFGLNIVCAVIGNTRDCQLQFITHLLEGRNHSISYGTTRADFNTLCYGTKGHEAHRKRKGVPAS